MNNKKIVEKVKDTLIRAASSFTEDQKNAYIKAIERETEPKAKWVLENILENAKIAELTKSPICDDTGIPHVLLEVGYKDVINGEKLKAIEEGIKKGLIELPGRPMAVMGNDEERIEQSKGLNPDSGAFEMAPICIKNTKKDESTLHILMQGGGPEIRSRTYRVFHKHSVDVVKAEIIDWAAEEIAKLGCTPVTIAIGIGRTHYEASSLMLQAMISGNYEKQNEFEKDITVNVNKTKIGVLGLGGQNTVLATFLKVGPQRASGVRIVCMRPCCCFEPRRSSLVL